jgi:hypothetical protein
MVEKRYSFKDEEQAKNLILNLISYEEENIPDFKKVRVTDSTHGIVVLGFQDKYTYNEKKREMVLVKKATTFDVDVMWKSENKKWAKYEVKPLTPNHKFAI